MSRESPWSSLLQSFFESSSDLEAFILREGGLAEIARFLPRLCERLRTCQPCKDDRSTRTGHVKDDRHATLALQVGTSSSFHLASSL